MFVRHEILKAHYRTEIEGWNWAGIKTDAAKNAEYDSDADMTIGRTWLGTPFGIHPSGKVYAFWTSNQTRADETRDAAYIEALEEIASEHGMWIDAEEDYFACVTVETVEA